ncbi:MAG: TonB family protein [Pyrinomonadaceae bacterium]|nr:TonB family protein [Pyrinomonadaceae bacterium]
MFRTRSKSKQISLILFSIIFAIALTLSARAQEKGALPPAISIPDSNKEQDGLIGPVRRVRTERAQLSIKSGKLTEGPRSLLNTTTYNLQGNSTDNTYYLVTERNPSVGKEEYKYDDNGNVTEMTLRNTLGGILSREVYTYEFDVVGNWNKMVTSLVIYEGGQLNYEPVEVTYRSISYYSTEAIAKGENSASSQTATPVFSSDRDTARESEADGHATGNKTASRSDDPGKSRPLLQRATTVNSGPMTDSSATAGGRAAGSNELENTLINKADGDLSEDPIPKPQARLFSDGAASNKVIMIPNATYPDEAKRAGVTGTVAVVVEIDVEGKVLSARAARGHAMLQASAVEAAMKARFSPTHTNRRSKRSGVISFTFSLIK